MPTFTSQTSSHACLRATFTCELPSSTIRCPATPFRRRAMFLDVRAKMSAPFACDTAVRTYKCALFQRMTQRTGTLPTKACSLVCSVAARACCLRATASAVLTCFHRFPRLRLCFSFGHVSKRTMLQEDTPASGNWSLQGLPIALRSQRRRVLPAPALAHCRIRRTRKT